MTITSMILDALAVFWEVLKPVFIIAGIVLLYFFILFLCAMYSKNKELTAEDLNNKPLYYEDSDLMAQGKMSPKTFLKNMDRGKYYAPFEIPDNRKEMKWKEEHPDENDRQN